MTSGRPTATAAATDASTGEATEATANAATGAPEPAPEPRRARVRNRLLVCVAVCALTVIGAGTPAVVTGSDNLSESQHLVDRASLDQQAISLSHSLADERDGMVEYVAAGRTSRDGAGLTESQRTRVDRQVDDIRKDAPSPVRRVLAKLPHTRQQALAGHSTARDVYEAYTGTIDTLQHISDSVARGLPARAQDVSTGSADAGTAEALPDLGRAVGEASATRGLLRGALAARGPQQDLTAEAQRAHVREQAALADFDDTAGAPARDTYAKTVNGTDVALAERYLAKLTDQPYLDGLDRTLNHGRIESSLSARIDSMRGVQSSFAADELNRLEKLRDDDVTALELRIALLAGCLLIAVGISVQTGRSMARPLSVLTRGSRRLAEDPVGGEPVAFHGRNDEFAETVRSLNQLRETAADVQARAADAEADNAYLVHAKDALTAERDRLQAEYDALKERFDAMPGAVHGTFVNLAMRTLNLVERQLGVIEALEEEEHDPDQLSILFRLDHLATRMRRHSENLLLLAGADHAGSPHARSVPLLDVLRAAISEIERYERIELGTLPPHAQVSGFAADDVSHLVAELLDNAASFSPPEAEVRLSGWLLESGEIMLSVEDEGIGVTGRRLSALNARLNALDEQELPATDAADRVGPDGGLGMGLYVVGRLAARHGLRVQLRERRQGGITAVVAVPSALLPSRPTPVAATAGEGSRVPAPASPTLPGTVAEANSNALPVRRPQSIGSGAPMTSSHTPSSGTRADDGGDPLVSAAEQAIRDSGTGPEAGREAGDRDLDLQHETEHPREHERAPGGAAGDEPARAYAPREAETVAETEADADADADFDTDTYPRTTDMGLPKRTPRHVEAQSDPAPPRQRGANAEELRRRLGGFQQGAQHGRRDAAAEADAEEHETDQPGAQSDGGTAEEART